MIAISKKFGCHRSTVQRFLQVNVIPRCTTDLVAKQVTAFRKRRAEGTTYAQVFMELPLVS